jgi:phage gp29-like protein
MSKTTPRKKPRTHLPSLGKKDGKLPNIGKSAPVLVSLNSPLERAFAVANMDADRLSSIIAASENGFSDELFRLARAAILTDSHIQAELFKRKNAVLGDPISVQPWDPEDASDKEAADAVEALFAAVPDWQDALGHLLDAVLWPVSLAEKVYGPADPARPELGRRTALLALHPVPYRLLAWDEDGNPTVAPSDDAFARSQGFSVSPPLDRERYVLHRGHLLTAPDRYGGPLRAVLWLWLLSSMSLTWWARHLERYGSPFIVGRYDDSGSDRDRNVLEAAISYANQLGGLVVSAGTSVELHEAATAGTDGFERFRAACRAEISRLILGQTLSSTATPTGIGQGASEIQNEVRQDIRRFDGRRLAATLREQIALPWLRLNGYTGRAPTITFAEDTSEETARTAEVLGKLSAAGLEPTDDALPEISERIGFAIQRKAAPAAPAAPAALSAPEVAGVIPFRGGSPFYRREAGYGGKGL